MIETYILKSACWLSGFALIYIIFLRNERFFELKRIYLLAGLILSGILPLLTIRYEIPLVVETAGTGIVPEFITDAAYELPVSYESGINYTGILLTLYLAGVAVLLGRLFWNVITISFSIRKNRSVTNGSSRIIRDNRFSASFSFFSYVLIHPSVEGNDLNHIINHELVHVRQKHWIDLVIAELIRIVQWMNPFAWIYISLIRKNHEYLADAGALLNSSHPSLYKAALLNQMFRAPVFGVSNSFSYSVNRNRFEMMKKRVTSPYRKLKTFLILPVSAFILYAFAEPVYVQTAPLEITAGTVITAAIDDPSLQNQSREVNGTILTGEGKALAGASIAVTGSKIRAKADDKGNFKVSGLPDNSYLLFSAKGYITQVLKPVYGTAMTIKLEKDPKYVPETLTQSTYSTPSIIVIDGEISEGNVTEKLRTIPTDNISTLNVLRGDNAVKKYGERARDGALEITTKSEAESEDYVESEVPFVVVEEMPMYPGGDQELLRTIANTTVYPERAKQNGIEGRVIVRFAVTPRGTVDMVSVIKGVDPDLDNEAIRVVSLLNNFIPGRQGGKPVPVWYMVPITFTLKSDNSGLSENSKATLLKYFASNLIYPAKARTNSITGQVLVRIKTEKGGIVREAAVADNSSNLPKLPEVVVAGYRVEPSDLKGADQGDIKLLEAEVIRVAYTIGSSGIPELTQKDMEFIIPVRFVLKDN